MTPTPPDHAAQPHVVAIAAPITTGGRRSRPPGGRLIALTLLLALPLAGCTPAAPPTPAPISTVHQCTPEAGGESYVCTAEEYDDMVALDALYDEAETVYRRHMTEVFRLAKKWELSEVTPEIEATASGRYLELLSTRLAEDREDQIEHLSGDAHVRWVRRYPGKSVGGSIVALWTCVDGSDEIARTVDAPRGKPGIIGQSWVYFRRVDGTLKLSDSEVQVVESC